MLRVLLVATAATLLFSLITEAQADSTSTASASLTQQQTSIKFGYFPVVSTVALYKRFSSLRDHLANELGQPVVLQTAKDFPTFKRRTDQREYDIVVTAPHFALRAADSGLYKIKATLTSDVQQVIVVREDSPIQKVTELAGKQISTPPKGALMTKMGIQYFNQIGLKDELVPQYMHYTSHNAANEAVIGGEAVAAIASTNIVKKAIKQGAPLRILEGGLSLPNMATLVASDREEELGQRIVTILTQMNQTESGRAVLRKIAFPGYREVDETDYEIVRPYL